MAPATYAMVVKNGNQAPTICGDSPVAPTLFGLSLKNSPTNKKISCSAKPNASNVEFKSAQVERRISSQVSCFDSNQNGPFSSEIDCHRIHLKAAAADFRTILVGLYIDALIWLVGSFAAGIDLPTSDLDFTISIPSLTAETSFEKLKMIMERLQEQSVFKVVKVIRSQIPVLMLVHTATGVEIDVTIDNDTPKRNTQLLRWYGQIDNRFTTFAAR